MVIVVLYGILIKFCDDIITFIYYRKHNYTNNSLKKVRATIRFICCIVLYYVCLKNKQVN